MLFALGGRFHPISSTIKSAVHTACKIRRPDGDTSNMGYRNASSGLLLCFEREDQMTAQLAITRQLDTWNNALTLK